MSMIKSSQNNTIEFITAKKLSQYIDRKIALLKIDVEGAELQIMNDVMNSNKINLIDQLIIEFHPHLAGISIQEFTSIITANNFTCYSYENAFNPSANEIVIYCVKTNPFTMAHAFPENIKAYKKINTVV